MRYAQEISKDLIATLRSRHLAGFPQPVILREQRISDLFRHL